MATEQHIVQKEYTVGESGLGDRDLDRKVLLYTFCIVIHNANEGGRSWGRALLEAVRVTLSWGWNASGGSQVTDGT